MMISGTNRSLGFSIPGRRSTTATPISGQGGRSEAWCLAGGRISARDTGDVSIGKLHETDQHVLPQSPRPRGRGNPALLSDRWNRSDGGLRQDRSRPHHGSNLGEHSLHFPACRSHDERLLAGGETRLGNGYVAVLGRKTGRKSLRRWMERAGGQHRTVSRTLYDDGHGLHDDSPCRGPRPLSSPGPLQFPRCIPPMPGWRHPADDRS